MVGLAGGTGWRQCIGAVALCLGLAATPPAAAQDQGSFGRVIRVPRAAFTPEAGRITFSEKRPGARNPFYLPRDYGADASGVKVTFGGFYVGQSLANARQCPPGAGRTGCLSGKPTAPLRLSGRAPTTLISPDRSNPSSPSLSGWPRFNGPVSILFDKDVAGVGLVGGFFNEARSTAIQAYDRHGNLIGGVRNIRTGMEYMALVTEDGRDRIAGLQFSLVGPEPAGFGIDDLTFAFASQLDRGQIGGIGSALATPETAPTPAPAASPTPAGSLGSLFANPPDHRTDSPAPTPGPKGSLSDLFGD